MRTSELIAALVADMALHGDRKVWIVQPCDFGFTLKDARVHDPYDQGCDEAVIVASARMIRLYLDPTFDQAASDADL
jgi:hypothetical protein